MLSPFFANYQQQKLSSPSSSSETHSVGKMSASKSLSKAKEFKENMVIGTTDFMNLVGKYMYENKWKAEWKAEEIKN